MKGRSVKINKIVYYKQEPCEVDHRAPWVLLLLLIFAASLLGRVGFVMIARRRSEARRMIAEAIHAVDAKRYDEAQVDLWDALEELK